MRLTSLHNKNYTEFQQVYQLKLPLELEMLIPVDDSARLLSQILEGLDYSKLYQAYSIKGRKPAVDPKTMFKVLTYAYMNGIYTSHKIETSCRRDIVFRIQHQQATLKNTVGTMWTTSSSTKRNSLKIAEKSTDLLKYAKKAKN